MIPFTPLQVPNMLRTLDETELFDSLASGLPETAVDPTAATEGMLAAAYFKPRDIFRNVVTQLKTGGMSFAEILSLVKLIYDLITEYGPAVADIVRRIRERMGK